MGGENSIKHEEVDFQRTAVKGEPPLIKRTQQEREHRIQDALEDDEVKEALENLRACQKSG